MPKLQNWISPFNHSKILQKKKKLKKLANFGL